MYNVQLLPYRLAISNIWHINLSYLEILSVFASFDRFLPFSVIAITLPNQYLFMAKYYNIHPSFEFCSAEYLNGKRFKRFTFDRLEINLSLKYW